MTDLKQTVGARVDQAAAIEDLLWYGERTHPRNVALSFDSWTLDYASLADLVRRQAAGLQALGVKENVKVGILIPNHPAFVVAFFAVLAAGAVVVTMNPLYDVSRHLSQIDDCEVQVLLTLERPELRARAEVLLDRSALRSVVVAAEELDSSIGVWRVLGKDGRLAEFGRESVFQSRKIRRRSDVALLQFTGGTSGILKAATLSHGNILSNVSQYYDVFPMLNEGREVFLGAAPLFHIIGISVITVLATALASEIAILGRFAPTVASDWMCKREVTFFIGVPTMCTALNNISENHQGRAVWARHLRAATIGGSPLPSEVRSAFEQNAGVRLQLAYGLSETSPVASCERSSGHRPLHSCGLPLRDTRIEIRSLSDSTQSMPIGEVGEVCIAGPQVMQGYWKRPEENDLAMVGEFLRTGDVGRLDSSGHLFLVDRVKDIIICSGYNVYPAQVEEALYRHPDIREAAAIGVPDSYRGESVKAIVTLEEGADRLTLDSLQAFLNDKLSSIEMPKHLEIVEEVPKTTVGKISRKELREREHGARAAFSDHPRSTDPIS